MSDPEDPKVVSLHPPKPPKPLHPGLEELLKALDEHEPREPPSPDEDVIADEAKFKRRFGFSWGLRHRRDLMRLKAEYDLSDGEIIFFKRTGNLRRTPVGVQLSINYWVTSWGALQFAAFSGLAVILLIVLWPQLGELSTKALKGWALLGFLFAISTSVYVLYLLPWQIFRRVVQQRA